MVLKVSGEDNQHHCVRYVRADLHVTREPEELSAGRHWYLDVYVAERRCSRPRSAWPIVMLAGCVHSGIESVPYACRSCKYPWPRSGRWTGEYVGPVSYHLPGSGYVAGDVLGLEDGCTSVALIEIPFM
jgi:hypothetical protein